MPLMEGGSLADQMWRFQGRFREAARLVETIARAVHSGHQQGILHRDLKPANVLLDSAGVPYVADFGLARVFDSEAGVPQTGVVEGTLSYMALEQAQPNGQPLTVAVDVYSLGVILYELLTGRLPFEAESLDRLLTLMREGRPVAPRALQPRIPPHLEAICLKCLEKEPAQRYGSAAELADDLRRFLEGRPALARPAGSLERAWMWCLRHPLGAGLLATLLWALLVAVVGSVRIARELEDGLRSEALRASVHPAPAFAAAVLRELEQYGQSVGELATRAEFVTALQKGDKAALESFCKELYDGARGGSGASKVGSPFDRGFVLGAKGKTLARWPPPKQGESEFLDKNYDWRDYFLGAQRQAHRRLPVAYLSRAFESEANNRITFALSVPIYGADRAFLGVLVATVASDSTLGSLRLHERGDMARTAILVALTDRCRDPTDPRCLPESMFVVIVHGHLERGTPLLLRPELAQQLKQALAESPLSEPESQSPPVEGRVLKDYRDPRSGEPGLAAFARVGYTGFFVIVQTREHEVLAVNDHLARSVARWSLWFVLGLALVWLVLGWSRFRSSKQDA
jgi:serine/threonine-protein kinase